MRARAVWAALSILIGVIWHPVMGQNDPILRDIFVHIDWLRYDNGLIFIVPVRNMLKPIEPDGSTIPFIWCGQVANNHGDVNNHIHSVGSSGKLPAFIDSFSSEKKLLTWPNVGTWKQQMP